MHKLTYRILFILSFVFLITNSLSAQSGCEKLKDRCDGYGEPYKYSGQSKSGTFELGQTSEFKMTTFGGFEYSVSLCAAKQLKGAFFRIKDNGAVLYDGQAEGDKMNWKQFYIEDSKSLIIEVVIPENKNSEDELDYDDTIGCIAVIIEYHKIGKKGFK